MSKYIGIFKDRNSVAYEFRVGQYEGSGNSWIIDEDFPTDDEIIVAAYEYEDYTGSAFVLFQRNGKLYEVHAGHCSCYGLEGQWEPEETSVAALQMRPYTPYGIGGSAIVIDTINEWLKLGSM